MNTWTDRANCLSIDPDEFFPAPGIRPMVAMRACATCPVSTDCLDAVLEAEGAADRSMRHGIFAGTTPPQRVRLHLERKAAETTSHKIGA